MDCLLEQGFCRITVLDLSDTALARARDRLSGDVPVEWVVAHVLELRRVSEAIKQLQTTASQVAALAHRSEPNADAGNEGLAQIAPPPLRQIAAQSYGTRHLGYSQKIRVRSKRSVSEKPAT